MFAKLGWDVEEKVHSTELLQDLISQQCVDLRGKTKRPRKEDSDAQRLQGKVVCSSASARGTWYCT